MEHIKSENLPLLIGFGVMALILLVWMIYRNLKDEKKFEHDMDETGPEHHLPDDKV